MREKTYSFTIEEIPIIVTKKRMKNMYLRISKEDGSVRISAPHQMSDERIYRFAKERIDWIRVYRKKYVLSVTIFEKIYKNPYFCFYILFINTILSTW